MDAGHLFYIEPLDPSLAIRRIMVVSDDVRELIDGPWQDRTQEIRGNSLRANLEAFVTGDVIRLSMTPYRHGPAYMGLLDPPSSGHWDVRSRDPQPSLRVLGHFAELNVFVALVWRPRSKPFGNRAPLGNTKDLHWEIAKLQCDELWRDLFPEHAPKIGDTIDDFVSENKFLV